MKISLPQNVINTPACRGQKYTNYSPPSSRLEYTVYINVYFIFMVLYYNVLVYTNIKRLQSWCISNYT